MISDNSQFTILIPLKKEEALKLPPMSLAFIGDAVQSLYTRTRVTVGSTNTTGVLHKKVTQVVKAVAQAAEAEKLMPEFDEDEKDVFRRARNCKLQTSAKNADIAEYRRASGFEAVIGFLYLTGNTERMNGFLKASFDDSLEKQEI